MKTRGFTLIEVLIVVGILAVLIGAIAAAIRPARQFAKANNARRWADVMNIMNAISQNIIDHQGTFDTSGTNCGGALPATIKTIKKTDGYDLCGCIVPEYIGSLSVDPTAGTPTSGVSDCTASYDAGYTIIYSATTGRVTITAPGAQSEDGGAAPVISITR